MGRGERGVEGEAGDGEAGGEEAGGEFAAGADCRGLVDWKLKGWSSGLILTYYPLLRVVLQGPAHFC